MDNEGTFQVRALVDIFKDCMEMLNNILIVEQALLDSLPESQQGTEKYEKIEELTESLEEAVESIQSAIWSIEGV